jgi:hypothetical protein
MGVETAGELIEGAFGVEGDFTFWRQNFFTQKMSEQGPHRQKKSVLGRLKQRLASRCQYLFGEASHSRPPVRSEVWGESGLCFVDEQEV